MSKLSQKLKILNTPIENISSGKMDMFACIIMLIFILSPVIASLYGFRYKLFITMMDCHMTLMQNIVFPVIYCLAVPFLLIYIVKMLKERKLSYLKKRTFGCFGFLIIWMLISTCFNGWDQYALLGDDEYRYETIISQICLFLVFFFIAGTIRGLRARKTLVKVLILVSIYLSIVSFIYYHIFKPDLYSVWKPQIVAVYFNTNHYGYYLTVAIMLSAGLMLIEKTRVWRIISIISMAINTVTLSFNNTFGCWLACLVALVFQVIMYKIIDGKIEKRLFMPIVIFIAATFFSGIWTSNVFSSFWIFITDLLGIVGGSRIAETAGTGRWKIWKATVGLIAKRPLFGYGIEGTIANGLEEVMHNERPHNEYLQYAFFYGIPAGIAYLFGCLNIFLDGLKKKRTLDDITKVCLVATFGYLVSAFFGNTMFYTAPYLFIFMGMAYGGIWITD